MAMIQVTAADGHALGAYVALPEGEPKGAVVVVQEIFGVNRSIRGVADDLASEGYLAIAPALFDRYEVGVELGYGAEDMKTAFEFYGELSPETALQDVAAAFAEVKKSGHTVAVLGFCYGGLLSWLSSTRAETFGMTPACVVGFYPGGVGSVATEEPTCPVLLHFGGSDSHIGPEQVEAVRTAHPEVEVYVYPGAEHGFFNVDRPSFDAEAAKLAWERSVEFLSKHVA